MAQADQGGHYTGFGPEWQPAPLAPEQARRATDWVEARIDRRALLVNKDQV